MAHGHNASKVTNTADLELKILCFPCSWKQIFQTCLFCPEKGTEVGKRAVPQPGTWAHRPVPMHTHPSPHQRPRGICKRRPLEGCTQHPCAVGAGKRAALPSLRSAAVRSHITCPQKSRLTLVDSRFSEWECFPQRFSTWKIFISSDSCVQKASSLGSQKNELSRMKIYSAFVITS